MDEFDRARDALSSKSPQDSLGDIEEFVTRNLLPGESLDVSEPDALLSELKIPATGLAPVTMIAPIASGKKPTLNGYLACALTGLSPADRRYMFQLSETVSQMCHEVGIDLYEPRKNTDPHANADIADTDVFQIDRDRVLASDVIIFLSHFPSVGAGQELDFAYNAMIPIIVVMHSEVRVSRMVTGIPGYVAKVEYTEPEQLRDSLGAALDKVRPILLTRRAAFAAHDRNIVGERIRSARDRANLTRGEVEKASEGRGHITAESLARWEQSSDRDSNLSLLQLRELAYLLGTTVSDLVELDIDALHLAYFNDLVAKVDENVARDRKESYSDRWKLLSRMIGRLSDDLDHLDPQRHADPRE